jgi:hypothetical protein
VISLRAALFAALLLAPWLIPANARAQTTSVTDPTSPAPELTAPQRQPSALPRYAGLLLGGLALGAGSYFGGRLLDSHDLTGALKPVNLGARFVLELGALAALGYWGATTGTSTAGKIALGLGAPLVAAVVWGLFVAPKATYAAPATVRPLLEVAVFGTATAALVGAGRPGWAVAFALSVVANSALMYAWKQ